MGAYSNLRGAQHVLSAVCGVPVFESWSGEPASRKQILASMMAMVCCRIGAFGIRRGHLWFDFFKMTSAPICGKMAVKEEEMLGQVGLKPRSSPGRTRGFRIMISTT